MTATVATESILQAEFLVLRIVHVLGGIFWLGSGLFTTFFLLPAMAAAGPTAGQIMANLTKQRLFVVLPTVAVLTILSGLRLMMIVSGGFDRDYFASITGKAYSLAGIAATVAFLLSLIVARPASVKVGTLSQQIATAAPGGDRERIAAEMKALQDRIKTSSVLAMILLLFAAGGMAVARYL